METQGSDFISAVHQHAIDALEELIALSKLKTDSLIVVGCSTSEIQGKHIGSTSNIDVAESVFTGLAKVAEQHGVSLAFQCCEHLNRALVVERCVVKQEEICNVIPQIKAGGAMATTAYTHFDDPVVVEFIKADAGLDIGDTFIGMHLKHVAVPVRLQTKCIGEAHVTAARVRPKFIGGARAIYKNL